MRPQSKTNKLTEAQEENGSPAGGWLKYSTGLILLRKSSPYSEACIKQSDTENGIVNV